MNNKNENCNKNIENKIEIVGGENKKEEHNNNKEDKEDEYNPKNNNTLIFPNNINQNIFNYTITSRDFKKMNKVQNIGFYNYNSIYILILSFLFVFLPLSLTVTYNTLFFPNTNDTFL